MSKTRRYECTVTNTFSWYGDFGREANIDEELISTIDLDLLYVELAKAKRVEGPGGGLGGERTIEFGPVRVIDLVDEFPVRDESWQRTEVWREHQVKSAEWARQEERKQMEAKAREKLRKRELFRQLKEELGDDNE